MSSSRIFVRGLPPSLHEEEFKKHFEAFAPVTDVKLLAQRGIGYVGFQSDQDAASAIKYFNKSYIRMSRIRVEVADNTLPKSHSNHPTATTRQAPEQPANVLKRKRSHERDTNDLKWKEYKTLMKPPASNKSWDATPPVLTSPENPPDEHTNIDETVHVHARTEKDDVPSSRPLSSTGVIPTQYDGREHSPQDRGVKPEMPASDNDWMRSRTSRLLGLLDEDEEESRKASSPIDGASKSHPVSSIPTGASKLPSKDETEVEQEDETPSSVSNQTSTNGGVVSAQDYNRLFIRNLPYTVADEEIESHFQGVGAIEEVHVPRDPKTGLAKGFAFVQFNKAEEGAKACETYDGTVFQGRLLHIISAAAKRNSHLDEQTLSKLPLKKQRQIQRKSEATSSSFSWNSLFMNADSVLSSISDRLGVAKSEILDPTSAEASVKLAQAETHVIQETKNYFASNGIDLEAFKKRERDDSSILVKNFPYGTTSQELKQLFSDHGTVIKVLMPPSGTIAIVRFELSGQAKAAFGSLAYRKYKDSVLFLEKAPKGVFKGDSADETFNINGSAPNSGVTDLLQPEEDLAAVETATLYVRNINFATSNEVFRETFQPLEGFISARIKTKSNPNSAGDSLSMGFGFVEFRSAAQARVALAAMNGHVLDGHQLVIRASHKGNDAAQERRNLDATKRKTARKSKLVIKNLPFEASKKDVRSLFKSYGQLRAVRVPRKFDNSRKGYAFAEFSNPKEAENALVALRNTHLLGRRLVLDYAADDAENPEQEIINMQRKVERQANNVALQRLASGFERKKVNMTGEGNEDEA